MIGYPWAYSWDDLITQRSKCTPNKNANKSKGWACCVHTTVAGSGIAGLESKGSNPQKCSLEKIDLKVWGSHAGIKYRNSLIIFCRHAIYHSNYAVCTFVFNFSSIWIKILTLKFSLGPFHYGYSNFALESKGSMPLRTFGPGLVNIGLVSKGSLAFFSLYGSRFYGLWFSGGNGTFSGKFGC